MVLGRNGLLKLLGNRALAQDVAPNRDTYEALRHFKKGDLGNSPRLRKRNRTQPPAHAR
jgi:hypothetical protein